MPKRTRILITAAAILLLAAVIIQFRTTKISTSAGPLPANTKIGAIDEKTK